VAIRTLWASVVAAAVWAAPAAAVDVFPGDQLYRQGLTQEDLVVHRMDEEFYTESWYLMSELDGGGYLFLHYGLTNAGPGSFKGAVEATVIDKDGKIHFDKSQIDREDITYSEDELAIDYAGKHAVRGTTEQISFSSDGKKIQFELELDIVVDGLVFGDGKTYFDDKREQFYALAIITPKGKLQGSLTVGGETREVSGLAYSDHAWQNFPAHKMADRLFSLRAFNENQSLSFLAFVMPDGQGLIPTVITTEDNEITLATHKLQMKEKDHVADEEIKQYKIPQTLLLRKDTKDTKMRALFEFAERLQRQDAVKDFNFLERTLIKMFVAEPILYRYGTNYKLEVLGETPLEGSGVAEIMILREQK